eukprot:TRINITY_DN7444_c0_g1_i2.p1 TRINITY_DN7444_c0_g1~~TRINITY_DN7444_c0_g1_i2.p1  ORF type:complete len:290 (+),score=66.60 TRINITY_DN7444_c0_g1_i2:54-872(+)
MADQLDYALDLMRRLPPADIEDNLACLIDLVPDLCDHLLTAVDQPLKIAHDAKSKKDYLLCDYNRDGDSYRSPWSNKYDPPIQGGAAPSSNLRQVEVQANEIFDIYRDLYFEGGVSSVYCWDLDGNDFAAVVLVKKSQLNSKRGQPMKGSWDSIHVVEVNEAKKNAHYKLTSTVMLSIETETKETGKVLLSGSLTRQAEKDFSIANAVGVSPHVCNIGRMVEAMENTLRQTIDIIYFGRTSDIANELRQIVSADELQRRMNVQKEISGAMGI